MAPISGGPAVQLNGEEAWRTDTDENSISMHGSTGQDYRFGEARFLNPSVSTKTVTDVPITSASDAIVTGSGNQEVYEQAAKHLVQ